MAGEKGNFKSRVFGGFNRHDVIGYIEKLAAERNDLARENQTLRGKIDALEERLHDARESTPEEGGDADRLHLREVRAQALSTMKDAVAQYDELCADLKINITQTDHELKTAYEKLARLTDTLSSAGERLEELCEKLEAEEE